MIKLISDTPIVSDTPHWPQYSKNTDGASNMVFSATDNALNIHVEYDTYRAQGIGIWNNWTTLLESNFGVSCPQFTPIGSAC